MFSAANMFSTAIFFIDVFILWPTNLLDGVKNIFPLWREPWSLPGQDDTAPIIRLV